VATLAVGSTPEGGERVAEWRYNDGESEMRAVAGL
jgi:hypothetical protein